jgi:hypothetical protein
MEGHRGLPLVGTESIKNLARKEPILSPQAHSNFRIILYWKRNLISGSLFDWKMLREFDAETRRWDERAGLPAGCVKLPIRNALEVQKGDRL